LARSKAAKGNFRLQRLALKRFHANLIGFLVSDGQGGVSGLDQNRQAATALLNLNGRARGQALSQKPGAKAGLAFKLSDDAILAFFGLGHGGNHNYLAFTISILKTIWLKTSQKTRLDFFFQVRV
jgi:hypothetical protein